jgi:hypothetical protein
MYMLKKVNRAIGNRMGRAAPNMKVTYKVFRIVAYLKCIKWLGPEYKLTYCAMVVVLLL